MTIQRFGLIYCMSVLTALTGFTQTARAACAADLDNDGVCNNVDQCNDTVPGAPVDAVGCPAVIAGDYNRDGDVDLLDLDALSSCQAGPAMPIPSTLVCQSAEVDLDLDGDVDMDDFGIFQRCYRGQNIPASAACMKLSGTVSGGKLRILGTPASETIALRLRAGLPLVLEVDLGNDGTADLSFNRGQFTKIDILTGGGDDTILVDEVNGIFTDTEITTADGGNGNDRWTGGTGGETYIARSGNDIVDGNGGTDLVQVEGTADGEVFTITANGTRVRFDRLNPSPYFVDIGTTESLLLHANAGGDSLSCTGNLAALITITADGGTGNDTLLGSNGIDLLIGGDGDDFIDGQQGNDVAFLGANNDTFQWDPGDGSDTVEGQDGTDTLVFNGSSANENITLSPNGGRLRLFRDIGSITMDINDLEVVNVNAFGGTDNVIVDPLAGTDVTTVNPSLAAFGGAPDGAADSVLVNGTPGNDTVTVVPSAGNPVVTGLGPSINVVLLESSDKLVVNGLDGNDTITLNETGGPIPGLTLTGGIGNDTLTGGSGPDILSGGPGNDTLLGKGGLDTLGGDEDNDTLTGGDADDTINGGTGDDRIIWNPGDDTDVVNGDSEIDTVEVNGGNGDEQFTITANGTRVRFDRLNPAPFSLDIGTAEKLVLNANGGTDSLACTGNLAALIAITADGGTGNDTLLGSNGIDLLIGGDGDDFIDGQQGNDVAFLGANNDTFQWDPGDGSDVVEGQAGTDTLLFNGSAGSENFDLSANGGRFKLTRNLGNIVMDLDDVEQLELHAFGGTDLVTVNALTGTDVTTVGVDLGAPGGGGDAAADNVIVNGTSGNDDITMKLTAGIPVVTGNGPTISVPNLESGIDRIVLNGLDGQDNIVLNEAFGALPASTLNGGANNDSLTGGSGNDLLSGGLGNDTLQGKGGIDTLNGDEDNDTLVGGDADDTVNGGTGDDRIIWNPGDDTDVVNGDSEIDTVEVNGGNGDEQFTITANGTRVRFDRLNPAPFSLDIGTAEKLVLNANGGADSLACTGNLAALIAITADGGTGNDTLLGSNGADLLIGGDGDDFIDGQQGNDVAFLGANNDTFQWDPGDGSDTVEGQTGTDKLVFNGSAGSEIFDLSANGARFRFTRNLGSIVMDLDDVEQLELHAFGGIDSVTVNPLTGTDVTTVGIDLAAPGGGGDAAADTVTLNGTAAPDVISLTANVGIVQVAGLPALVQISGSEFNLDTLVVNGLGGADMFQQGPGVTALIMLSLNQ